MIKVIVEHKETGVKEEYRKYKESEIWLEYSLAIILVMVFVAYCIIRRFEVAVIFLGLSYLCFSKGREMSRQNLLIDFIVDLSQALNEKDGDDD